MAMPTAPVTMSVPVTSHTTPLAAPARPQPRVLWPWPTFLLGIAALVGVWYARPYIQPSEPDRVQRDLGELRRLLERSPLDFDRTSSLAQEILDKGEQYPQFVGEAHYLLGCAHMRRAEDPSGPEGASAWDAARKEFELAGQAGVPEADQPRLLHKLGKILHLTKADPKAARDYLMQGEDNENPTERWQLLAEAHMAVDPPDVRSAIDAARNQLTLAPPNTDPNTLSQTRLNLSDWHLRLNELAEARKTLERIDPNAPTEVYLKSRFLLARCYSAEGNFKMSAATWEQVRNNPRLSAVERGQANFELGQCYAKSNRSADALDAWRQAQIGGGDAQQAAALRQAELQLTDAAERTQAVALLEKAFETVTRPEDYRNALISAKEARAALENMSQALRTANDYADAAKVADICARLSPPGKGRELPAEVADAWAQSLISESKKATGAAAQHALEEARKQYRKAGTACADAATASRPIPEQLDCLRRATAYYFKAQDKLDIENGLALLERMTKLSPNGEADGEVVFLKALAHQQLGHKAEAIDSYKKISSQPEHPNAARARYQLALLNMDGLPSKREEQEPLLEQVTVDLEKNVDPALQEKDREVHEQSMYLLGEVTYQRRDWAKAQTRLEAALRFYPQNPHALMARFMLGRCSWFQAAQESQLLKDLRVREEQLAKAIEQQLPDKERESAQQEWNKIRKDWEAARARYRELLEKSKKPFEEVENTLLKREQDEKLADGDRTLLRQAAFGSAETYFFLEEYDEAIRRYQILRIRYEGQLEEVFALSQLWQCHALYQKNPEKAKVWVDSIREALTKLPDTAFDGSSPHHKRDYWDTWVKQVSDWMAKQQKK